MDVGTVNTVVGIVASTVATVTGVIAIKEYLNKKKPGKETVSVLVPKITSPAKIAAATIQPPPKGVLIFENNEAGYLQWISDNPNGFVVNAEKSKNPNYMPLHRAVCRHVSKYSGQATEGAFTERGYIKACSSDKASLNQWAQQHGKSDGPLTSNCLCRPNDS